MPWNMRVASSAKSYSGHERQPAARRGEEVRRILDVQPPRQRTERLPAVLEHAARRTVGDAGSCERAHGDCPRRWVVASFAWMLEVIGKIPKSRDFMRIICGTSSGERRLLLSRGGEVLVPIAVVCGDGHETDGSWTRPLAADRCSIMARSIFVPSTCCPPSFRDPRAARFSCPDGWSKPEGWRRTAAAGETSAAKFQSRRGGLPPIAERDFDRSAGFVFSLPQGRTERNPSLSPRQL